MDSSLELYSIRLLHFMGEMGIRYLKDEADDAIDYVMRMIADKRVIIIDEDGEGHTVLFFSVCHDSDKFLKKKTWEFKEHEPDGHIFYVEKVVSRKWSKSLTMKIHDIACEAYPQIELGMWHRYGRVGDREFKFKVRPERLQLLLSNGHAKIN